VLLFDVRLLFRALRPLADFSWLADYDKIGAQYSRVFLWTTLRFYTPIVMAHGQLARLSLESVAGPFDAVEV